MSASASKTPKVMRRRSPEHHTARTAAIPAGAFDSRARLSAYRPVASTGATSQYLTGLGRPLAGTANVTGALIAPGRTFEGRLNQLDLRFSKLLRFGAQRVMAGIDVYNVFNSATVLAENYQYGTTWRNPTALLDARILKVGIQMDF